MFINRWTPHYMPFYFSKAHNWNSLYFFWSNVAMVFRGFAVLVASFAMGSLRLLTIFFLLQVVDFSRPRGIHFILSGFPQKVIMCRWIRWTWSSVSGIMHCGSIFHTTFMPATIVWAPALSCWSHGMLLLLQHAHCLQRNTSLWPKATLVKIQPFKKVFLAIGHLNNFIDAN